MHASRTPDTRPRAALLAVALATTALLAACGGGGDGDTAPPPVAEDARPHDARTFTPADAAATTFAAMPAAAGDTVDMSTTSRWAGVLNGSAYRIEVPANWNGRLVMYAHGFRGTTSSLTVSDPSIRRHLIQRGYAWAASSYSRNYYDVRAGVEDTNGLALAFNDIAGRNGRTLAAPTKIYITGHSMGGHIAGAAVEAETAATARNKVTYAGAVPMCGVMGDTELFNQFAAMQMAAQGLAGVPAYPSNRFADIRTLVTSNLFSSFPNIVGGPTAPITPTANGQRYLSVVQNITGGPRPLFAQGIAFGGSFPSAYGTFGSDGTIDGILTANVLDTTGITFRIDGDTAGSTALNAAVPKITPAPDANRLRRDGLRWVPKVNGEIRVPVVSIHTLGDLFVPFSMQQVYKQRVDAKGNSQWLVQRAIRGASHCDFTVAEQVEAFEAMVAWEQGGATAKPAGDDVLTAATVAQPTYGCTFTRNTLGTDDSATVRALRAGIAQSGATCPAP